ncbi:MAG: DNA methyltransferase [Candidatus Kapabacteria bacterium]|nr:DNA methyltransferase [Candidatus Kapabacteria bacterium]
MKSIMNNLYFEDCLDVLKKLHSEFPKGFIDLIYIDPPFNSKRNYNILFESIDLKNTKAQKEAFSDTWSNVSYQDTISEIREIDLNLYKYLSVLDDIKISISAISYLSTMAIRIWYMHKVLKDTGSFYLHCDPNMSHYLKIICDLIFGSDNFKSEITWQRTNAHNDSRNYAHVNDIILYYTKAKKSFFSTQFIEYSENYINKYYKHVENSRKFLDRDLTADGLTGGGYKYEWKGVTKLWRCPVSTMERYEKENRIYYTNKRTPRLKQFLDDMPGVPVTNNWTDIPPINSQAQERLGYPTQKPLELLERIIQASSNEGDLVADFFCGCGTTLAAAQKLKRNWLGVDISHLAIQLILKRLTDPYPEEKRKDILKNIDISGLPKDIASAHELAQNTDNRRVKFQDWVIEVLIGGVASPKKSADGGCDGYFTFPKTINGKQKGTGIIEVKSGNITINMVRSFMSSVDAFKADIGVFVCFEDNITDGMRREAKAKGQIENSKVYKIQILSIDELLDGIKPKTPLMAELNNFEHSTDKLKTEQKNQEML